VYPVGLPVQVPFVVVSTTPTCGFVGVTAGATVLTGAEVTALVTLEVAGVEPLPFEAVTIASSVCPTSPLTGV
jgi:hypothetical protein